MTEEIVSTPNERLEAAQRKVMELDARFKNFSQELSKEGALSYKVKQLIALGISVVKHCDPCMRAHAMHAFEAGASGEEVIEACFMAVQMDGGPSMSRIKETVMKVVEEYENAYSCCTSECST